MPIKDWPRTEQPREKLLAQGPDALSRAELLAIFLRIGQPDSHQTTISGDIENITLILSHFFCTTPNNPRMRKWSPQNMLLENWIIPLDRNDRPRF